METLDDSTYSEDKLAEIFTRFGAVIAVSLSHAEPGLPKRKPRAMSRVVSSALKYVSGPASDQQPCPHRVALVPHTLPHSPESQPRANCAELTRTWHHHRHRAEQSWRSARS